MKKMLLTVFAALAFFAPVFAQSEFAGAVRMDKTVHDFGDVFIKDGPVRCTFTLTNISSEGLNINSVVSSCGCTDVKWTRETIAPGAKGTIEAKYSNDEGAYPFDKTLTVYVSAVRRPIVLHLRGVSHEKQKPLPELYPVRLGQLGLRSAQVKGGNLQQGESRSGEFVVANLGSKAVALSFRNVAEGLTLGSSGSIPAGGTGKISYTVRSDRSRWGTNRYAATLLAGGKVQGQVEIVAVTKENFAGWSRERKASAARPVFEQSTFSFDPVRAGAKFDAGFICRNDGKEDLIIYKIESDSAALTLPELPSALKPGAKMNLKVGVDTKGQPAGEQLYTVTLYTNAPLRPIVNLFVAGFIK